LPNHLGGCTLGNWQSLRRSAWDHILILESVSIFSIDGVHLRYWIKNRRIILNRITTVPSAILLKADDVDTRTNVLQVLKLGEAAISPYQECLCGPKERLAA